MVGLTLALYASNPRAARADLLNDPRMFSLQATDANGFSATTFATEPDAVGSVHLDARNHDVLLRLHRYAEGRSDPRSALGPKVYTASSDLYMGFAAHTAVGKVLDAEWLRLAREMRSGSSATLGMGGGR